MARNSSPKTETEPKATKTEPTPEEVAVRDAALAAFSNTAKTAVDGRDTTTGDLAPELAEPVKVAYRELADTKTKNAARKSLQESAFAAMKSGDFSTAKAFAVLTEAVTVAAPKAPKAPKAPADPTDARALQIASVGLAYRLVSESSLPEGVQAETLQAKTNELYQSVSDEQIQSYQDWLDQPSDTRGDAPQLPSFAVAALKILNGKAAKVKGGGKSGDTYNGPRRSIEKHVEEAFAGRESGAVLKISEIVNAKSSEYGDDSPSSGAVSGYLFDKGGEPRKHANVSGHKTEDGQRAGIKV